MKTIGYQSYFTIHRYGRGTGDKGTGGLELKDLDVENKYKVRYRDVKVGSGAIATNDPILQVRINFVLYNDTQSTVYNSSEQVRSPAVVHLCDDGTPYGPGEKNKY
ncbi:hypothetical protein GH714_028956 [Hevea brasiliensis]|uniref:Uncharacterized protein n=1 Tax=Hevea brasiliensis TaxID=3981 RepID=A0A6A6K974_HEVBR|nr:hypothetical protein GH714_028956 [Hevea brasiliensis]